MPKFKSSITYYVPVFKINKDNKGFPYYPTFEIDIAMATTDEQMAYSFEPDEVLVLAGSYDWDTDKNEL